MKCLTTRVPVKPYNFSGASGFQYSASSNASASSLEAYVNTEESLLTVPVILLA